MACGVLSKCYPGMQKKDICLHSFCVLDELISGHPCVCEKKNTIFVFFEIFENISKSVCFLRNTLNTCFVANLASFEHNFKLLKLVAYCQSYASKSQSHFFSISLYFVEDQKFLVRNGKFCPITIGEQALSC